MKLSPDEQDKLLLHVAGIVARDRRQRGGKLDHPDAVALRTLRAHEPSYLDRLWGSPSA